MNNLSILSYALQAAALGLSAAATPGPFQAYMIAQSLRLGWRRALPVALAPLLSDGPIIIIVLFVLTRLPGNFLRALQLAGAVLILFLAWKSWQALRAFRPEEAISAQAERQSLFQAALMNLLNPNPYIFWSIIAGPILIAGWQARPLNGVSFLAGFYVTMVAALAVMIVVIASARQFGPKVIRFLLGLSALALAVFGLYQLYQGILGR